VSPRRLQFHFAADSMREATELARELRLRGDDNIVRVRPLPALPGDWEGWGVAVETPPTPMTPETILRLHQEMAVVTKEGTSWRYLGWRAEPR
jgi:hypothetical protein